MLFYLRGRDHIEAVLEAVMRQSTLEQRLKFAVQWDRADMLESQLAAIPSWQEERSHTLRGVLSRCSTSAARRWCAPLCRRSREEINLLELSQWRTPMQYALLQTARPSVASRRADDDGDLVLRQRQRALPAGGMDEIMWDAPAGSWEPRFKNRLRAP